MLVQLHISRQITHFLNSLITPRFCFKKPRNKERVSTLSVTLRFELIWEETFQNEESFYNCSFKHVPPSIHLNLHFKVVPMSTFLNQFLCSHSFTNLSMKCLCNTLIIHTRKNMHLFQVRQFATNSLRNKNQFCSEQACRQSSDKATSKIPLQDLNFLKHEMAALLSCPSACSSFFPFNNLE